MLVVATLLLALEAFALDRDSLSSRLVPDTAESLRNDAPNSDDSEPEHGSTSSKTSKKVDVKAYGAVGDGLIDDTAAFNAVLQELADAGGGVCVVSKGTYIISASGITRPYTPAVSSDVHLVGESRDACILKISGMPTNHLLQCDGNNWSVENLTFDMGDYMPKTGLVAIACKGTNWRVSKCAIVRTGRWAVGAFGGSNWSIEGNSPYNWARMGWNRKTLKPGDQITITFYPSKVPGTHAGVIAKAVLADGTEVLRFQRDTPTTGDGVR